MWDGRLLLTSQSKKSANDSLTGVRDLHRHAQLRKLWNNAFQPAALIDYEDMLRDRAAHFMTRLQKLSEDEVCIDLANLIISFLRSYFPLPYYYRTYYIVTVLILWAISCICLPFSYRL